MDPINELSNKQEDSNENVKKALSTLSDCYFSHLKKSLDLETDAFAHYTTQRIIHLQRSIDHYNDRLLMGYLAILE